MYNPILAPAPALSFSPSAVDLKQHISLSIFPFNVVFSYQS